MVVRAATVVKDRGKGGGRWPLEPHLVPKSNKTIEPPARHKLVKEASASKATGATHVRLHHLEV